MTDDEETLIGEFEADRWDREGWKRDRDEYVIRLKGQQAQLTKRRIANYQNALALAEQFDKAYEAFIVEPGDRIGGTRMAAQLEAQGVETARGFKPTKTAGKGKAWADAIMTETDDALIHEAVLECRTLMTARCLSANFDTARLGEIEAEYVEIIADALALGRRLRNQLPLSRGDLLIEARREAISKADEQRRCKQVTMAARERYWRDRPAPVRKIFE
jgi:hypothetical protein